MKAKDLQASGWHRDCSWTPQQVWTATPINPWEKMGMTPIRPGRLRRIAYQLPLFLKAQDKQYLSHFPLSFFQDFPSGREDCRVWRSNLLDFLCSWEPRSLLARWVWAGGPSVPEMLTACRKSVNSFLRFLHLAAASLFRSRLTLRRSSSSGLI